MMEYQIITKVSKNSPKNNSGAITNDNDEGIPKEIPKDLYLQKKDKKILIIGYFI